MKTYKHLSDEMEKLENIHDCFLTAAKRKTGRPDVAEVLKPERDPGDDSPGPRCLPEHEKEVQRILINELYEPPRHGKVKINENGSGKVRDIVRPKYKYEQVIHHCLVKQLQPIVTRGMYEHALGSIPGRGPHSGRKQMRKWIDGYKGRKFYVLKCDTRHCYQTEDIGVIEAKLRRMIKDEKYLRLLFKVLECEAEERTVDSFLQEIAEDVGPENAARVAASMLEDETLLCGLPLGFVTSHWIMQLNYRDFDRMVKETWKAEHYMRYADDIVVLGRNKKELHRMREKMEEYLEMEMHQHLKRNWQIFRFEYEDRRTGKVRGRALDFMGFVFHRNRTTIRKAILKKSRRKANRIKAKGRATWYDAAAMLSYIGWYNRANAYGYYLKYIKPCVNIQTLKRLISRHTRKEKAIYDRMGKKSKHGEAGRAGHQKQPAHCLPAAAY